MRVSGAPELESLPSEDVSLLLRSLSIHKKMLAASHQDAKRLADFGTPPCYLIDYQLLHQYMYPMEFPPERVVELEYLFSQDDISFVLGNGTLMELIYRVRLISGVDITAFSPDAGHGAFAENLNYEGYVTSIAAASEAIGKGGFLESLLFRESEHLTAIMRLENLIHRPNFKSITNIRLASADLEADTAFEEALSVLNVRRPRPSDYFPNVADALNFADVVGMRRASQEDTLRLFTFHLTNAPSMLDERKWGRDPAVEVWGFDAQVSRPPLTAIYGHLVSTFEPKAETAADYTAELLTKASLVELQLRLSSGYRKQVGAWRDSEFDELAAGGALSEGLKDQFLKLSEFVADPVISEAQHIYDNTHTALASWTNQQRESSVTLAESPRKVFDLVIGVARVLETVGAHDNVRNIWERAIRPIWSDSQTFRIGRYVEVNRTARAYLQVEQHAEGYSILTWPTALPLDQIIAAFVWAYARQNVDDVKLYVGCGDDINVFDAELPTSLGEITNEIEETIDWIRMVAPQFDLHANRPSSASNTPTITLIGEKLHLGNVLELYAATSSRFMFRSWLAALLIHAGLSPVGLEDDDALEPPAKF